MADILYRSSMNVSPHPVVLPLSHHRRFRTKNRSPMYLDTAPIAVNNKIKAIQARKTPITLLNGDNEHTDIRQLHFGYNGGVTTSRTDFSVLTAERLVDRSKDIRLDRIYKRQNAHQSILSNTSTAQQSSVWPKYHVSTVGNKQNCIQSNSTINTSPAVVRSSRNKSSPGGKMPEINRRRNRQPLAERENTSTPIEQQKKSILKTKASQIKTHSSLDRTHNHNNSNLKTYETEEEDENVLLNDVENTNIVMDEDFERYLEAAIIKCADWLIKYVFDQTIDDIND